MGFKNMVETVGDRLKRIRLEHDFTQNQIAEYLGFITDALQNTSY